MDGASSLGEGGWTRNDGYVPNHADAEVLCPGLAEAVLSVESKARFENGN
jgi:hypothetical protein